MAEIINLRKARKERARSDAERRAEDNRALHGLSKAEKSLAKARREQEEARLSGLRLIGLAAPDKPN